MPGLSLSRHVGESIRIGTAIVTVTAIERSIVRLRIEAPRDVEIMRTELERDDETDEFPTHELGGEGGT